jgi:hypothetical protein
VGDLEIGELGKIEIGEISGGILRSGDCKLCWVMINSGRNWRRREIWKCYLDRKKIRVSRVLKKK